MKLQSRTVLLLYTCLISIAVASYRSLHRIMKLRSGPVALLYTCLISVAIAGCSSAAQSTPTLSVNDTAATLVSKTFSAATRTAQAAPPTLPPLPKATATLDKPRLYVNTNIQCRTGTRSNFKVVATLPAGTIVDMIGKDSAEGAWLVTIPNSTINCWVQIQDSSPSGSFQMLPEVTPQPTTQQLPTAPIGFNWSFFCDYGQGVIYKVTIKLSWSTAGSEVNGFRVYRGDTQVAELPADITSFSDTAEVTLGTDLSYSVEAYNDAGVSPRHNLTIHSICK